MSRLQRRLGFRIVARAGYSSLTEDFNVEIERLRKIDPDILCLACRARDGVILLKEIKQSGFEASILLSGTGDLLTPDFGRLASDEAEGLLGAAWWVPHIGYPGARIFRQNFLRRHNREPDYHNAQGYAAMWVIADAVDRAEKTDREAIRNSLEKTDLMTVYGPVRFESYGHKNRQNRLPSLAVRWENGVLRVVRPPMALLKGRVKKP